MIGRLVLAVVALLLLLPAPTAQAAFPGQNGRIAFADDRDGDPQAFNRDIFSINPDGAGLLQLTSGPEIDNSPSWSPDGQRIVFTRRVNFDDDVMVMNADGSGATPIVEGIGAWDPNTPSWSPDGQKIIFTVDDHCDGIVGSGGVFTVDPDGSDLEFFACGGDRADCCTSWSPDGSDVAWSGDLRSWDLFHLAGYLTPATDDGEFDPDWSPSGHKLIFGFIPNYVNNLGGPSELRTMNPDGSGQTPVRPGGSPVWSPNGQRIAFTHGGPPAGIWTADADGTGGAFLTSGSAPSWQPIPVNSYPRPKGATPFRASLAIAYRQCVSPHNRTHGPPLTFPSCHPPQQTSDYLTVGTADANAQPALNEGHMRLDTQSGAPGGPDDADVAIEFFMDDVFRKPPPADYTGELRARIEMRVTDKDNTPHPGGPGAATTTQIPLELIVTCTPVAAANEGSACTANTSADALAPGTVKEGRRSIWQLGAVEVYDGGPDDDAHNATGDTLLAIQGIFIP